MVRSVDPPAECDVAIVGAGILGLAVARELALRHDGIRIAVLEREPRIGTHQTGRTSGVIHAGVYYAPGSLKARLCVEGARDLYAYCERRGITFDRNGKLILATREQEIPGLDELERRGNANAVPGLRRVGADEIAGIEPHARGVAGLHSPNTGVVDFTRVAVAYAQDLGERGGTVALGCEVTALRERGQRVAVEHARGETVASAAVTCAGVWSDRLAVAAGADPEPRIVPFRGAYLRLRPERRNLVQGNVYPVPDPALPFLGAHLTRGIDGEVLLGPTALIVGAVDAYRLSRVRARDLGRTLAWPGTWRLIGRQWRAGIGEVRHAVNRRALVRDAARMVPELRPSDITTGPAGIRAQALARDGSLVDDFVVSRTGQVLHVRNAPSPAATSSLALARLIADRAEDELGMGG
jgi:(S)-2-hydroxyglutarate dehydrogenase